MRLPSVVAFSSKVALAVLASNFLPPESDAQAQTVPAGRTFRCTPVAVWDGDGPVWCAEGPRVRIAGVAAREMDGSCKPNQPCPSVGAGEARNAHPPGFGPLPDRACRHKSNHARPAAAPVVRDSPSLRI
jgi:endonuclease YncB( thermonuclease family)